MKAKTKLLAVIPILIIFSTSAISVYTSKAFVDGTLTYSQQTNGDVSYTEDMLAQSDTSTVDNKSIDNDVISKKTSGSKSEATSSNGTDTNSIGSSDQESGSSTGSFKSSTAESYCNGNYSIPEGVCETLVKVKQNPTPSNSLIIGSARTKLASLPKAQSLSYNEANWLKITSSTGTIRVVAKTSLGNTLMFATLEKRSNTWYITDIIF